MSQQELLAYIKPNLEKGFKAEQLKAELLKAGWEETAVNEAFSSLEKSAAKRPNQVAELQKKEVLETKPIEKEVDIEPKFNSNSNANLELGSVQALNRGERQEDKKEEVKNQEGETKSLEKGLEKKKISLNLNPKLKLALIILLSVIVLGALAFFVYARFQDSPMKVLEKSLLAMEEVSSFDYSLEIKGDYQWNGGNFSDIISDPFALFDIQETEVKESVLIPSKHQAKLILSGYSSAKTSNLDSRFDISLISDEMQEGEKIELETRFIQDQAYLKLSLPSSDIIDLSILENKWLKVALKDTSITTDLWEGTNKIKEAVIEHEPFKIADTFSGSLASGQKTYHYILEFDKVALEKVLLELEAEDASNQGQTQQELKEYINKIELISGELVVGRDDFLMHQFALSITMKEGAYSDDQLQILNLNFNLSLQSFNEPINVVEPDASVAIEEVIGELFESFLANTIEPELDLVDLEEGDLIDEDNNLEGTDLEIDMELDSDLDGLTDYEEINIYGTDPLNPDTDGDSYSDGEEVLNGYNPLGDGLLENSY